MTGALTPAQRRVLELIAAGHREPGICRLLGIAPADVARRMALIEAGEQ